MFQNKPIFKDLNQDFDLVTVGEWLIINDNMAMHPASLELVALNQDWSGLSEEDQNELLSELVEWTLPQSHLQKLDLTTLTVNVTQVCNLKCLYCAAGGDGTYGQAQKRILIEQALPRLHALMDQVAQGAKQLRVSFSGGEPLLYPQGIEVLSQYLTQWAQELKIDLQFSVITNGTLLTDDNLELLAKYRMSVSISLDGSIEANQQSRPSATSKDWGPQLIAGLERLQNYKNQLGSLVVAGVFNTKNSDLWAAYQFYQKFAFDYYEFNIDYYEKSAEFSHSYLVQITRIAEDLYRQQGLSGLRKLLFFDRLFKRLDARQPLKHHCGAGQSYLTLSAQGQVFACPWTVGDQKFERNQLSSQSLYESQYQPPCGTCWVRGLCGGGCRFHHDVAGANEVKTYCQRMKSLILLGLKYYKQERL